MTTLDWIVLALFALALIGIIIWVLRNKAKNTSDYFLAGRDATWIAIGASIFASNIGSEHLVGLAGSGAESGMAMGALGDSRLAHSDARLVVCAILRPKQGFYHA
jgi:SSS family solute:Na+ symporter